MPLNKSHKTDIHSNKWWHLNVSSSSYHEMLHCPSAILCIYSEISIKRPCIKQSPALTYHPLHLPFHTNVTKLLSPFKHCPALRDHLFTPVLHRFHCTKLNLLVWITEQKCIKQLCLFCDVTVHPIFDLQKMTMFWFLVAKPTQPLYCKHRKSSLLI